ncbi:DUF4231 domain-containing protein [Pseudonocardia sp.]|uniref:DUF4231 domain-containing protein n=1 Tax=Pseudonocardia sp. TaxID=60912 RepID=UPI00345C4471
MAPPEVLDELWCEQSVWSQSANRMKHRIDRARVAALIIVVVVAITGTAAGSLSAAFPIGSQVLACVAAAGSALLPLLRPAWSGTKLRNWTRARSASEALKSDIYLWLAGAGPFVEDSNGARLRSRVERLRDETADLAVAHTGIEAVKRSLPSVHDLNSFFALRVTPQIDDYYVARSIFIRRRIRIFRFVELGLGFVGAALGVLAAAVSSSIASWIAVVATIGTALAVHVSATRYEFQLIEFTRTAQRLRQIRARATAPGATHEERLRLAAEAEEVISVENQGWMTKLAEEPPTHDLAKGSDTSA